MKSSWFKLIISGVLICQFCLMQSSASAASGDGLQVYQRNMHLFPERKAKLAKDIDRYRNADNIWDTMRSEFTLPHYEDNPHVQEMIEYFMNNQDELYQSAERAAPYLYYILQQVRERHLPAEVALLPIFESAYNPYAYSPVGAAGIWQLMPATASGEGIKQNRWYDGRRDVVASTKAALNHLVYLGNFFDGNWLLAIAAYDTGEGNILAAIRHNERESENTEYWNLHLVAETRSYIPKLMALAVIISNPKKYPVQLPFVRNAPYLAQVDVGSQISLKEAADLAGLSFKKLQQLNPGFNHAATAPNGPYKLVLPIENVEEFSENLAESGKNTKEPQTESVPPTPKSKTILAKTETSTKPTETEKPTKPAINLNLHGHYALKPGDTLYMVREGDTIQKIANHFHTTANTIREANQISRHTVIAAGSELVIPTHSSGKNYQLAPGDTIYMVRKNDTIEKIAERYHTTPEALRVINLLADNQVKEGDRLVIPTHV